MSDRADSPGHTFRAGMDVRLERFAREAGIPQEYLPLFAGKGTPLLLARKT